MLSAADELIYRELDACIDLTRDRADAELRTANTWKQRGDHVKWEKHRHAAIVLKEIVDTMLLRRTERFEPNFFGDGT
jgi:hypothetical protein